jgi:hypothetical protein
MANVRKRILELTALESASLNTTIVGVDGGITYKIELDTLADAVTSRVNILDRDRLASLESVTSSFEIKGRSVISSSAQITSLGFISSSTTIPAGTISSSAQITLFGFVSSSIDITSLNSFTSSQSSLNTAFTNGISARLQTSSFNEYTASQSTSSLVNRLNAIESVSGSWITESETGSFLTSLSGAISSSTQISDLGFVTGSYTTINSFNSLTQSFNSISQSFNVISGSVGTIDFSTLATTASNTFIGNQTINGALEISQSIHNWEFGTDGILKLNNGYGEIYADADSGSVRIGTAAENVAPNAQIILGGFNEVFKIKSGPPLREWTFEGNGDFNLSGSIVGASNLATTASNTFIGNQTISGSTYISGGLNITNNGYSWSFESNGRTKIPNITFNSDRGTGMVGIKPVAGREFQIETSTAESSAGPWVFGLDGTLSAPNGANILRVGNLVTTASFNSYTASQSTSSLVDRLNTIESVSGSYATTGSNQFNGNQTITGSLIHGLEGNIATGEHSHAEGSVTKAIGNYSHAEGDFTQAKGDYSHAEGQETIASGSYSHAEGYQTIALGQRQHVTGQYNFVSPVQSAFIVGNGTDNSNRSNLIHAAGNTVEISGSLNVTDSINGTINATNGVISGSSQLTSSYDARYALSSSFSSISSSFNSRFNGLVTTGSNTFSGSQIFSGSMVVTSGQIIASAITNNSSSLFLQSGSNLYVQNNGLVEITGSLNATSITGSIAATNGVISGSTQLTTAFPSKTTGAWSVPAGASTQSFTVEAGASYTMWVNGNIPNGIITWNATVTTSNTNVPVVGSQYGWYYTAGNALVLTAMPDQIIGTTNTLISSPTSYAPNTSNVFKFGITNNSGTTQTINYGYIKLS